MGAILNGGMRLAEASVFHRVSPSHGQAVVPSEMHTTEVKHPDEDDWKKLCRVIRYAQLEALP